MTIETDTRSRTRQAVVEAAARLLVEGGAEAVTTRGVAQEAGVQAPTIYRLFGDKDGLVEAVADHVMSTWVAAKAAAASAEDGDPVAALRDGWTQHVEFGLANPTLYVILSDPHRARSAATERGVAVLRERVRRVAAAGLLRISEGRAVDLIHATGTGVVLTLLATAPGERTEDLVDTAWEAVASRILTEQDREAATADESSAVVAFRTLAPRLPGLSTAERRLLGEWLDRAIDARS